MFRLLADECAWQGYGMAPMALFWSGLVGFISAFIGIGAVRQIHSADWPTVLGSVTASEVTGRKQNMWKLEYTYIVAGQTYTSEKYAYDPMPVQGEAEVKRHIAAIPVGAVVDVSYDPNNPADAVLRPGLRGCTLWVALFLTPFVLVGLGMWAGMLRRLRSRPAFNPDNARQVAATSPGAIVVRPEPRRHLATFLNYVGIVAALTAWALFFLGFGLGVAYPLFNGFLLDPPLWVPATVWVAVIAGCVWATWRSAKRAPVLTLDVIGRLLRFDKEGMSTEVPFAVVRDVIVNEQTYQRRGGGFVRHRVNVTRNDRGAAVHVAEYDRRPDAEAFAAWLRSWVGGETVS
jgi:hypothetical protein